MIKSRKSIVIMRPIDKVFEFLVLKFTETYPKIEPFTLRVELLSEGGLFVGAKFKVTEAVFGRQKINKVDLNEGLKLELGEMEPDPKMGERNSILEVEEFIPNKLFTLKSVSSSGIGKISYFFKSENNNTIITYTLTLETTSLFLKIAKPILRFFAKKSQKEQLTKLKALLELKTHM